jgi:hypothetical protein
MNDLESIEARERAERSWRQVRDARIKAEDSLSDLTFSLERFQVALEKAALNSADAG